MPPSLATVGPDHKRRPGLLAASPGCSRTRWAWLILMPPPPAGTGVLSRLREPPLDDRFERSGVDVVELVTALAAGLDQTRGLQNVEVLRDRLPRRAKPVLGRQARADLKERLPVPVGQLVEDRAARRIRQCLEDVTHASECYASRYLPVNLGSRRTERGWPRPPVAPAPPHSCETALMRARSSDRGRRTMGEEQSRACRAVQRSIQHLLNAGLKG